MSLLRGRRLAFAFGLALGTRPGSFCRSRERSKLALRFGIGLHHARGDQQRHRVLDGNIQLDKIFAFYVEEETGGWVGRARHERGNVLALWQLLDKVDAR